MIVNTIDSVTPIEDWKPDVIKKDGTLYDWPFRPLVALKWFKNYFFAPVQLYHTGLALIVWFFLLLGPRGVGSCHIFVTHAYKKRG